MIVIPLERVKLSRLFERDDHHQKATRSRAKSPVCVSQITGYLDLRLSAVLLVLDMCLSWNSILVSKFNEIYVVLSILMDTKTQLSPSVFSTT